MKLRNQSQLSLFFFQFSWFLMRMLSLLDTAPPVYFPRKRSSLAHSTLERFKVPLISDRTKTFSFLQVVVESCNTFWLYLKMQNFEVEAKFDFTFCGPGRLFEVKLTAQLGRPANGEFLPHFFPSLRQPKQPKLLTALSTFRQISSEID